MRLTLHSVLLIFSLFAGLVVLPACDEEGQISIDDSEGAAEGSETDEADSVSSGDPMPDMGGSEDETTGEEPTNGDGCFPAGDADATLSGTVYAPNLEIPVSGALVWASKTKPEGIPSHVYCAECVELDCSEQPYTFSEPDGSFELPLEAGTWWIAVQKGQFLNINEREIRPGTNGLSTTMSSLPDRNEPANDRYTPKIAVALGSYDRLEDGLAKLGLGETLIDTSTYSEALVAGTEQFDLWDNGGIYSAPDLDVRGSFIDLINDYSLMEQYHIIFVPCSNDLALSGLSEAAKHNIRTWVAKGGKWYASDWSNEFIDEVFPQYQDFVEAKGTTDLGDGYDAEGTVLDNGLLEWLEALPYGLKDINSLNGSGGSFPTIGNLPTIETIGNWSGILATPPVLVDDGVGGHVDVGHKVWVEGPGNGLSVPKGPNPMTISGEYGCGKLMFTTYHMAEDSDTYIGLTPQELVLLYLVLEIGVCQMPHELPM